MKYKGGKSWYDHESDEWKYQPRIYTDFYCSLSEWKQLGKGKENFMYQVRSAIVDLFGYPEGRNQFKIKLSNDLVVNKLSFDRSGRRDSLDGEEYSAWIIKNTIKLITHRDSIVEFYSWKGTIDHIEISFPESMMPNIIVLVDDYSISSTNRTLIDCVDAIYSTLHDKTTEWYDKKLNQYYNSDWDRIFYCSKENAIGHYNEWKGKWQWSDVFKKKIDRQYNDMHHIVISYK